MGYHTYLSVEIDREEPDVDQVAAALAEVNNDTDVAFWRSALLGETEVKWYDGTADMKQVSQRFPGVVITLSGEGEDSDDRWVEYHHNGKVQREDMPGWTPAPYDPAKLK